MKYILSIFILIFFFSFSGKAAAPKEKTGLLIIDAQKWFIPGHPESLYELWNIKGHPRGSKELIASMDSVLVWANAKQFPVYVTYEGSDTGRYDIPDELKSKLYAPKTTHFVKTFYAATKHPEFNTMIENSGIRNWIVIGAETDVCVYQTVKELLKKNMNVTLVKEAIYSGKNNPEVALNNLISFGATVVHGSDLYKGTLLFPKTIKETERDITYENVVLTIYSSDSTPDQSQNKGNLVRLEYLKKYAQIIGIPVEIITKDSIVRPTDKVRLFAGDFTFDDYKHVQSFSTLPMVIVSDCSINIPYSMQPKLWDRRTLKMVFYELMETAAFYGTPLEKSEGWHKKLKKALIEGNLDYVETSQNL